MSFETVRAGALEYLRSGLLSCTVHCFSTRLGGVSEGTLVSLNLGIHRGDKPRNVLENFRRLGSAAGFGLHDLVFTRQVHTDVVKTVTAADRGRGLFFPVEEDCDALITRERGAALAVFSADCGTILLYDPKVQAVGAVHAGWRGTALGIAGKAVEAMAREFGCDPRDIRAALGPCISRCCFETNRDVPDAMLRVLGDDALEAIDRAGEKFHVDLKLLNTVWLRRAGVERIDVSPDCTCCQPDRFWSHRRTGERRGSLASIVMLPGDPEKGASS